MINFRFHLVSLVAVFLALGVGVAMGASFIDRATVDTLRNRVDDLEDGYRERGATADALRDHLRSTDEQLAALLGESGLLAGRLQDAAIVVVAPASLDDAAVDATWSALEAAGAQRSGTVRLEQALELPDDASMAAARELLALDSATPSLVRSRLVARLGASLAVLTAADPSSATPPDGSEGPLVPTTPPTDLPGPTPTAADVDAARSFLRAAEEAGLLSTADAAGDAPTFPGVAEVHYVVLLADGMSEREVGLAQRLATEVAEEAPATVTVVETSPPIEPGELPTADPDRVGSMLVDLRNDDEAVERLSTVDHPDELLRRASTVLAVREQLGGEVGHYGVGVGATAALPAVEP